MNNLIKTVLQTLTRDEHLAKFDTYTNKGIYFVSRLKDNAKITVTEELPIIYSEEKKWASPQRLYDPL